MATKTFGYEPSLNIALYRELNKGAYMLAPFTMPETGRILKVEVKIGRFSDTSVNPARLHNPVMHAGIWRQSDKVLLSKSGPTQTGHTFGSVSGLATTAFTMDGAVVPGGTALYAGIQRNNTSGYVRMYYGMRRGGPQHYEISGGSTGIGNLTGSIVKISDSGYVTGMWIRVTYETGGQVKIWNGGSWVPRDVKVWNGSAWVTKPVKVWNGSAWVESKI